MNTFEIIRIVYSTTPTAYAIIRGSTVSGTFAAYPYQDGSIILVEAQGLPQTGCDQGIHGLHIHEGSSCTGTADDPFANTGGHFQTTSCPHPYHAGDLPPLFSTDGRAWMLVYIGKFKPEQIIDRTIVIHASIDNFMSQPSGNAGTKIACGEIRRLPR